MSALSEDKKKEGTHVKQYLSFFMADEEYGIDILSVLEIRGFEKTTPLPTAPAYVKGLINLRGIIVPIIDLRQRFDMPSIEYTPTTVIIILQNDSDTGPKKTLGVIVDAISDVYNVQENNVSDPPDIGNTVEKEYICNLLTIEKEDNKKMVIVLNVKKIFELNDVSVQKDAGNTSEEGALTA